ncbi:MAG: tetratricopeptide repeat protein, partial [Candidatus Cloacimonetes bacterium]|nr:tetratricopeptide repeat protein [Candidatus Cloacimonadota bacterium]
MRKNILFIFLAIALTSLLTAETELTIDERFTEIEGLFQQQNFAEALPKLDELLLDDPDHENALIFRISWNVLMTDEVDLILQDLARVAENKDENPESIYVEFGYVCVDNDRDTRAIELMNPAIAKFPEAYDLYVIRGLANSHLGNSDLAIADLEKALSIKPEYEYALIQLAKIRFGAEDPVGAMKEIDRILAFNPESHLAYHTRYNFYSTLAETENAIDDIQMAIDLTEGDLDNQAYYLGVLALEYDDLGITEKAQQKALHAKALGNFVPLGLLSSIPDFSQPIEINSFPFSQDIFFAWEVHHNSDYWFVAEIETNSPDSIVFDWMMSNSDYNRGRIMMDKQAVQEAVSLYNYFYPGDVTQLSEQTSVWVSRKVFQSLKTNQSVQIDTGNGFKSFQLKNSEPFFFLANDITVQVKALRIEEID